VPSVSFSPEQQFALLGHLIREQRVYDAAVHLDYKPEMLDDVNAQRIYTKLDAFVGRFKRYPTLDELKITITKGEDSRVAESALRTLDQALASSQTIGLETVFDDLVQLRIGSEFLTGMTQLEGIWNKQMQEESIESLHTLSRKLEHMSSNGLTAMAKSSLDWYQIGVERQKATPSRLLYTGLSFLDDPMQGLKPDDLMVLTAYTGFGKSQAMALIAWNIAASGKQVKFFALEAGRAEIENRLRFVKMSENYAAAGKHDPIDYSEWSRGLCPGLETYEPKPEELAAVLKNIDVTYRLTSRYSIANLERDIYAASNTADIVLVDHLHYIDRDSRKSETEALSDVIQRIREVNLTIDRPVILAAHIRKHQGARKDVPILPTLDDIHGSSDIAKCSTWVVTLAQPSNVDEDRVPVARLINVGYGWPTFVRILKSRDGGGTRTAYTMCAFFKRGVYHKQYTLGRLSKADTAWAPIPAGETMPPWADPIRGRSGFILPPTKTA
jgi:hypothetical protein